MEENNIKNDIEEAAETEVEIDEELINKILEDAEKNGSDEDDAVSEYNDTASQFAELEESLNEVNDKYMRLFAEYDNYRKRTAKEKTETFQNASVKCIEELLPFIDSFERSLEAECGDENFKNGMTMIFGQLKAFLEKMNVTEIEALGAEFDPNVHNAIQQLDGTDHESNHVCAVYQKGYMLGDKLVRPAMVAVAL